MNSRERIMAVLNGKEPDRIPFAPLIGRYYVKSLEKMGIKLSDIASFKRAVTPALKRELNLHEIETIKYVGADVFYRHVIAYNTRYKNVKPFSRCEGDLLCNGFETPLGTIYETIKISHGTEYIVKHMVESIKDIEIFTYVINDSEVEPFYQDFIEFDEYIGEDGIASLTGPVTPIQELLQFRMGVEGVIYSIMDYEDEMIGLFNSIHKFNKDIYRIMAQSPAQVAITYDDTSTTVLSPEWYTKYCKSQLDDYSRILHDKGKIHIVHMCGKIARITNQISEGEMDGIDSVCPPTTGDLEPGKALKEIGKVIIGGLDPSALVWMTAKECEQYAIEKLKQIGSGRNFILSTGDSTAAGTPVENLKAISNVVKELGKYPLKM